MSGCGDSTLMPPRSPRADFDVDRVVGTGPRPDPPRHHPPPRRARALALTDGPTPVADCIDECERLGQWHGDHHPGVLAELARLRAMQGDAPRGRELMSRARTLFVERIRRRRPLMFTAQRRAEVELLADGDLDMVQRELQAAFDLALDMGRARSGRPARRAAVTRAQRPGQVRRGSQARVPQPRARTRRERHHPGIGPRRDGPRAGCSQRSRSGTVHASSRRAGTNTTPNLRAAVQLDLATVLHTTGQHDQARSAARTAASLFHRKGNLVDARRAHELTGEGARRQQRPSTPSKEEPNSTLSDHNG